jgi:hypothetical protein
MSIDGDAAARRRLGGSRRVSLRAAAGALVVILLMAAGATGCGLFDKSVEVLYIGDSIMNQTGPFAQNALALQPGVGDPSTHVEAVNGSGLLTPKVYDWQTKARDLIATYKPKVVVVLFIGNYTDTDLWTGADGKPVPDDYGDAFYQAWEGQAQLLQNTLSSGGAVVDWVLPPPLASPEGARRQTRMRQTYLDLHAHNPSTGTVDAVTALGGPNGEWVWRRAGIDGAEVTVRQSDGVHLTDDGGRLVARQIAEAVAPQLIAQRAKAS